MGIEKPDENYCYSRDNQHIEIFWLDASVSGQSESQFRDIKAGIMRRHEGAEPNTIFHGFASFADTNGSIPVPEFTLCKPPATPEQQASINAPKENSARLLNRALEAKEGYESRVDKLLQDAQNADKLANDSPILEQVKAISMAPEFQGPSRGLQLITDGIQRSINAGSFCARKNIMIPFQMFKNRSNYETDLKPQSLINTHVEVLLVEFGELPSAALPFCTTSERRNWYRDFMNGNDAASVVITPLQYWGAR